MSGPCKAIVIGGTGSGVGKTSLTLGIARALVRRGLRVQTFKVGPDFLDPTYLAIASGRPCYNLDGWMCGRPYVQSLFAAKTAGADIAIVEGVMGLYDGATSDSLEGSTAQIATWLGAPVLLVVNAHGASRSMAAVVKGFVELEPSVRIGGVIANHCGSEKHRSWLSQALASAKLPPLTGAVPRDTLPPLGSRHLGLVSADSRVLSEETLDQLADAVTQYVNLDAVTQMSSLQDNHDRHACDLADSPAAAIAKSQAIHTSAIAGSQATVAVDGATSQTKVATVPVRIAIARDEAFHFYYPDNLELLHRAGAELVEFSPLHDAAVPDVDGLYLGGGYPEVHAARLSANASMLESVRRFGASGRCIYAECGGLMYLGRRVRPLEGSPLSLAGVLPIETAMRSKLKTLGYVQAHPLSGGLLGDAALRGHEFHYSEIVQDDSAADGWRAAYRTTRRSGLAGQEGFARGNVLASYIHIHFGSNPAAAENLVRRCRERHG